MASIDPEYGRHLPSLTSAAVLRALASYSAAEEDLIQQHRAACVRRLAERLQLATAQADDVAKQIRLLAKSRYEPLTRLCGILLTTERHLANMENLVDSGLRGGLDDPINDLEDDVCGTGFDGSLEDRIPRLEVELGFSTLFFSELCP